MNLVSTKSCLNGARQLSNLSKRGGRRTNRCHHASIRQIRNEASLEKGQEKIEVKSLKQGGWTIGLLALIVTALTAPSLGMHFSFHDWRNIRVLLYTRLHLVSISYITSLLPAIAGKILWFSSQRHHHASNTIHLIQPLYIPTNPHRSREIEYATKRNAALFKHYTRVDSLLLSDLFEAFKPDKINIIANADMYFDENINKVLMLSPHHAYALSRYEMNNGRLFNRPDSQDAWIFHGRVWKNLTTRLMNNNDLLRLGKPGIDNRLAFELIQAGYHLSNPSKSITSWHVHATSSREYTHMDVIPPPYAIVYPVTLDQVRTDASTDTEVFPHGFSMEQVMAMSSFYYEKSSSS